MAHSLHSPVHLHCHTLPHSFILSSFTCSHSIAHILQSLISGIDKIHAWGKKQSGKRNVHLGIWSLDLAIHGPALCLSATKALWGFLPYPWPDSSVDPWRSSRQLGFCRMPEILVSASSIHCSYAYALLHSLESCLSGRSKTRGQWNANSPVEVSTGEGISRAI